MDDDTSRPMTSEQRSRDMEGFNHLKACVRNDFLTTKTAGDKICSLIFTLLIFEFNNQANLQNGRNPHPNQGLSKHHRRSGSRKVATRLARCTTCFGDPMGHSDEAFRPGSSLTSFSLSFHSPSRQHNSTTAKLNKINTSK